jgi:hypothetical protein
MKLIDSVCRMMAATLLLGAAGLKLGSPHSPQFFLGPAAYHAAAIVEIGLAGALVLRWKTRPVVAAVLLLSLAGIAVATLSRHPCGCFGSNVIMSNRGHAILASVLGLCSIGISSAWRRDTPIVSSKTFSPDTYRPQEKPC